MIKTTNMMLESLKEYANPKAKLARMVKNRECFPIVKGLYETERNVPAHPFSWKHLWAVVYFF